MVKGETPPLTLVLSLSAARAASRSSLALAMSRSLERRARSEVLSRVRAWMGGEEGGTCKVPQSGRSGGEKVRT